MAEISDCKVDFAHPWRNSLEHCLQILMHLGTHLLTKSRSWTKICIIIQHLSQLPYWKVTKMGRFLQAYPFSWKGKDIHLKCQLLGICLPKISPILWNRLFCDSLFTEPNENAEFLLCAENCDISLISQRCESNSRGWQGLVWNRMVKASWATLGLHLLLPTLFETRHSPL